MEKVKKEKKGFNIRLCRPDSEEKYTVFFEEKGNRIIRCYVRDSFCCGRVFVGKANCHEGDTFNRAVGMDLAFMRAIAKRRRFYDGMLKDSLETITSVMEHDASIEHKFRKFLEKVV